MKRLLLLSLIASTVLAGCAENNPAPDSSPQAKSPSGQPRQKTSPQKRPGQTEKSAAKAPAKAEKKPSAPLAARVLEKLRVEPETPSGYDRDLFEHWSYQSSGCDTRDVVLARSDQAGGPCGSDSGVWVSAYDGLRLTDPGDLDVDHMVPLAEAWGSGAGTWSPARREAYANDLHPWSLIAVSASSNRSKSDQDPAEWMPTNRAFTCQYTARWIAVKFRWRLSVDPAEAEALRGLIRSCPAKKLKLNGKWERTAPAVVSAPPKKAKKAPRSKPKRRGGGDLLFSTCSAASAAGYGPYRRGLDPEYGNYRDADGDGVVCE